MTPSSGDLTKLNDQNPWPGLAAYDEASSDFFFGRSEEAAEVFRLIRMAPLTVVYGKSGLGKTSLLQAGLYPLLRAGRYLPIHLRVDFSAAANFPPLRQVMQRLKEELDSTKADYPAPDHDEGLWEYLHRKDLEVWSQDNVLLTPVLVFDQFEELFSRGGSNVELIQQVFDGLADLIENRIPTEIASTVPGPRRLRLDLLSQRYRIVLSFREDFLPEVRTWEQKVPSLLRNCLRLNPMTRQRAIEAVERAGKAILCKGVAPCIVDFIGKLDQAADATDTSVTVIEPVLLSLFCYQLNRRRKPGAQIDERLVQEAGQDILDGFYREALDDDAVKGPPEAASFIEGYLIQGDHFRGDYPIKEALDEKLLTEKQLAVLTNKHRLLRLVHHPDTTRVELIHDRLVPVVRKARDERRIKRHRDEQERLAREAQADATRMKWIGLVIGLLLLVAVYFLYVSHEANKRADQARKSAESAQQHAEGLLVFLLGEQFLGEIRDVGRSTMLEQVQGKVRLYTNERDQSPALIRGLALRNDGDIERTQGSLANSVKSFEEAVKLIESGPDSIDRARETARTRDRLGEALAGQGHLTQALSQYEAAVGAWGPVITSAMVETSDCASFADSLVSAGELKNRMGKAALASKDLQSAIEFVSTVLFGHRPSLKGCEPLASKVEPSPDAKALEVLSHALLLRSAILNGSQEDNDGAYRLASEVKRLRPVSSSATKQKATALAFLANSTSLDNPHLSLNEYREVLDEFNELRRRDPTNRLWERERLAVQLLITEGIVACHQSKTKDCKPLSALEDADNRSSEVIGALRALAQTDPSNKSLQRDLGWAWQNRATLLEARNQHAERLAALKNAERLYSNSIPDHRSDVEGVTQLGTVLLDQSRALADLDQWPEAKATLQRSIDLFDKLVKEVGAQEDSLDILGYLMNLKTEEGKLLRKAGDQNGADLADQALKRLEEQYNNLADKSGQESAKLHASHIKSVDGGAKLFKEGNHAAALSEFNAAESSMREYIRLKPSAFGGYDNLRNIYGWIQLTQEKLKDKKAREAALIARLRAAQIAALLESNDPGSPMHKNLHDAQQGVGILLNDEGRYDEALAMVQAEVAVAEALVQTLSLDQTKAGELKRAEYLRLLGNGKFGLGIVRRNFKKEGWQEAIRSAFVYIQKAIDIDRKNHKYLNELGSWRKYLADELDADPFKEEAQVEYHLALKAYQQAASLSPGDEDALQGIRDLAKLGIR